jgi:hypothetical protein
MVCKNGSRACLSPPEFNRFCRPSNALSSEIFRGLGGDGCDKKDEFRPEKSLSGNRDKIQSIENCRANCFSKPVALPNRADKTHAAKIIDADCDDARIAEWKSIFGESYRSNSPLTTTPSAKLRTGRSTELTTSLSHKGRGRTRFQPPSLLRRSITSVKFDGLSACIGQFDSGGELSRMKSRRRVPHRKCFRGARYWRRCESKNLAQVLQHLGPFDLCPPVVAINH